jgi:hypothetical protein
VVYAIQFEHRQAIELAAISAGGGMVPGELTDEFDQWLLSEPEPVDREKAQLLAALGVGP